MEPQLHSGGDLIYSIDTTQPTLSLGTLSRHFGNEGKRLQYKHASQPGGLQKSACKVVVPCQRRRIGLAINRGKVWDGHENETLAKAWVTGSEDPIVGVDQNRKLFIDTVRRSFI